MGVYLQDGLKIFHLDVAQAFVRAKLDTEIYMKLPGGCGDMSGKIVRLNRSLYGLKQSGRPVSYTHLTLPTTPYV